MTNEIHVELVTLYVPKVHYSEGPIFRRSCIPKVQCSEITRFYITKALFRKTRRFYVPKFQIVHPIESAWGVGTKTRMDICIRD